MNKDKDSYMELFPELDETIVNNFKDKDGTTERLGRLDADNELRKIILPYCRLKQGDIWESDSGHRVGVLDATDFNHLKKIASDESPSLIINDPPYNVKVGKANTDNLFKIDHHDYMDFSRKWVGNALQIMNDNAHLYIWLGADYKDDFKPLPDFMIMMREFKNLKPKNFITLRNQRGYGTQKNWMWIRQELLHYTKGNPDFKVVYTDIPKVLKGYYKTVAGRRQENMERSKSDTIRPGNVWIDIQQVFYRMEENVPGCYAQKPLKAIERIIETSSKTGDIIMDSFSHSGTTLIAGEKSGRRVFTFDMDPVFAELTIRRLEHYKKTGETGWQWRNPFPEIDGNN
ncbi:MAG: site-specific DNA-methyltransferase [Spirochaetota bacterium]